MALNWSFLWNGLKCKIKGNGVKMSARKLNEADKHDKIMMIITSSSMIKNIVTYIFLCLQEENAFHR